MSQSTTESPALRALATRLKLRVGGLIAGRGVCHCINSQSLTSAVPA
jgi:hypothetical protein